MVVVAIATRYKGYRYPIEVIGHAVSELLIEEKPPPDVTRQ